MKRALLKIFIVLPLLAGLAVAQEEAPKPKPAPKAKIAMHAQAPEPPEPQEPPQVFALPGGGSYLGVDTRDVTADRLGALKLKEERGVEITLVDKDAPAGKAGLREQDVILSFNGEKVESVEQLRRMIRETPAGRTVELGISRDGQPMTVKVALADRRKMIVHRRERPGEFSFVMPRIEIPEFDVPVITTLQYSRRNGLMVENLTPQLREFFGVKGDEGVLVRSVEKGSRAEAAGFKAGDVIVRVGNERINDSGDWNRLLRRQKGGTVSIGIVRERREQTLSLSVPERKPGDSSEMRFYIPEINIDRERLQRELERIQPEVQKIHQQALEEAQREVARARPQLEQALREAQRKYQREMREYQREMERLQRELQREQEEN